MNTYPTSDIPIGSTSPKVLFNNSSNFDDAMNGEAPAWFDRFGKRRESWTGLEAQFDEFLLTQGYVYIGDYDSPGELTFTSRNQMVSKGGEYWTPAASLALPYTTVNNWATDQPKFVSRGDAALRSDLAAANGVQNINGAAATVASVSQLRALSTTKASKWATVQNSKFVSFYRYDGASTATDNGATAVTPNVGGGRWLINHNGSMDLYQWGCTGDAIADDTNFVRAAVDWAAAGEFEIIVPSWKGARLTDTVYVSGSPRIRGEHIRISKTVLSLGVNETGNGAWFFIDHLSKGFAFNEGGTVVTRPRLEMVGTYRNQPVPVTGTPYVPLAADFDFRFYNCDSVMRDVVLWNASNGIQITATPSTSQSRGDISGVYGYPMQVGIQVDFVADVLRIDNIHFWPYFSSNPEVIKYAAASSIGILLKRCDNPMITRFFTYGYRFGLATDNYLTYGSVSKLKMDIFDFDAFGECGIFFNGSGSTGQLTNGSGQGQDTTTTKNFLEFAAGSTGNDISVSQIDAGYCGQSVFRVGGTSNNVLRLGSGIRCYNWNGSALGNPAIAVTANNQALIEGVPEFTAPLNSGTALDNNGSVRGELNLNNTTINTNASGLATLVSGLGRTPKYLMTSVTNSLTAYVVQQTGVPGQLVVFAASTGVPFASGAITLTATMIFE